MPLIKVCWKCIETDKIQEWAVYSVYFDTLSKILPNPICNSNCTFIIIMFQDVVMLNGFGTIVNSRGKRVKPYLPQICDRAFFFNPPPGFNKCIISWSLSKAKISLPLRKFIREYSIIELAWNLLEYEGNCTWDHSTTDPGIFPRSRNVPLLTKATRQGAARQDGERKSRWMAAVERAKSHVECQAVKKV